MVWPFTRKVCQFLGYCNSLLPGFPGYILYSINIPHLIPELILPSPLPVWGGISQKYELSYANLLLKVQWLSLLKTPASGYGWSRHWPCPLALLHALWSFCLKIHPLPLSSIINSSFTFSKKPFVAFTGQTNGSSTACAVPQIQHWSTFSRPQGALSAPVAAVSYSQGQARTFFTFVSPVSSLGSSP